MASSFEPGPPGAGVGPATGAGVGQPGQAWDAQLGQPRRRLSGASGGAAGAGEVTAAQLRDLQSAWREFDADMSGTIDMTEFKAALLKLGIAIADKRAETYFESADADRNGGIDFAEFVQLVGRLLAEEDEVLAIYNLLCDNHTKTIKLQSLERAIQSFELGIPKREIQNMFFAADANADRCIDRAEFDEILRQCNFVPNQ